MVGLALVRASQAAVGGSDIAPLELPLWREERPLPIFETFFRSRLSSSRLRFRSSAGSVVKGDRFAAAGDLITAGRLFACLDAATEVHALRRARRET